MVNHPEEARCNYLKIHVYPENSEESLCGSPPVYSKTDPLTPGVKVFEKVLCRKCDEKLKKLGKAWPINQGSGTK